MFFLIDFYEVVVRHLSHVLNLYVGHSCNIDIRDADEERFNFNRLVRSYRLNLSDSVERAIAIVLFHLIGGHQTYLIRSAKIEIPNINRRSKPTINIVDLRQSAIEVNIADLDAYQQSVYAGWMRIKTAAQSFEEARRLFDEVDVDGSGED